MKPALAHEFALAALNMRLSQKETNYTFQQVLTILQERNMTFGQLMSMPELDKWHYSDGPAMVCNVYVLAVYKAAGLFDGIEFEATETTPRDAYELALYDTTGEFRPRICPTSAPYCQITGLYKVPLGPNYSTIKPYNHMFENCGALPPSYERVPAKC